MLIGRLIDDADEERATIARLTERRRRYETALVERLDELERQCCELSARLEPDQGVDAWLQELGEEQVEAAVTRLNRVEPDEAEGGGDALAPAT